MRGSAVVLRGSDTDLLEQNGDLLEAQCACCLLGLCDSADLQKESKEIADWSWAYLVRVSGGRSCRVERGHVGQTVNGRIFMNWFATSKVITLGDATAQKCRNSSRKESIKPLDRATKYSLKPFKEVAKDGFENVVKGGEIATDLRE